MCNQPPGPAWINTRSGIRKGIRLPLGVVSQRNRCLRANIEGVSDPKGCRSVAIAGRMACILAAALLACASLAHGQVIEEGGFPVKGGGNSGEPFSLSCPPRLVAQAGESVLLSCTARGVPEEGVRYEWESLSGDGLHLLSDANERSPLFTAPVSGEGAEYVYRLTAMSVGVYETATVIVGVSGGSVQDRGKSPGLLEGCDSFGALEGFREGCAAEDKMPPSFEPFEGGFEGEEGPGLLFPEAPGLPDRPSGPVRSGGPGRQTPPRLECPVAVFLEELETGAIECHAWDALGEEFLEYSWEPVGSTTRDYLDNPRLIPEDAPNPSVVAPEAPVYETLESFHSGERTFRYRYRLTATSRATGLSSSSEVEVYVSSSRPSVYCPLEVVVEEGETAQLDCEGVDPLSARMDYDEEGASILWEWEGLWGTSMAPLAATDLSSPLFTAPAGSAGEEYHYIASMTSSASGVPRMARRRVTVRVTGAEEGAPAAADDSALMFKGSAPIVTCNDAEIYEATADFTLDCSVTDEPTGATYAWRARGSTSDTDDLSSTTVLTPTFDVPDEVGGADKTYRYTVTMSAAGIDDQAKNVTVIVLEKPNIGCTLINPDVNVLDRAMEPGEQWTFDPCLGSFVGAPSGSEYKFTWTGVWTACCTPEIALAHLDRTDVEETVFTAPTASPYPNSYIFFTYELIVSAKNADPYTISPLGVTVQTQQKPQLSLTCSETSYEVETGDPDFDLDCEAAGAWSSGFEYEWQWSPTDNLTGHDTGTPTFDVPGSVESDTTWTYTVSVSARDHLPADETVEVTVREPKPSIVCSDAEVYEATADFTLDCSVTNEPTGAWYSWSAGGLTDSVALDALRRLIGRTGSVTPMFKVPDDIDKNTDYYYAVDMKVMRTPLNEASVAYEQVRVRVLNKSDITVTCEDSPYEVDEGDTDIELECDASGGPAGSTYTWSWSPTTNLTDHNTATPMFAVLASVDQDTTYTYTVTATADNTEDGTAEVTVTVRDTDSTDPSITCNDAEVYEGAADFTLDCSVTNEPSGATYAWTVRGSTADTDDLSSTTILAPTFSVPDSVNADTDYNYTVTLSASGVDDVTEDVTVTVKKINELTCLRYGQVIDGHFYGINEGDMRGVVLDVCHEITGPGPFSYSWSNRLSILGGLDRLSNTNERSPTFTPPNDVETLISYGYSLKISSPNAKSLKVYAGIWIYDTNLTCQDSVVYEGSANFDLDCSIVVGLGAPYPPPRYGYTWVARDDTPNTDLLIAGRGSLAPTFAVPDNVDADTDYKYRLTVIGNGGTLHEGDVTVTVKNTPSLTLVCISPPAVHEGSPDIAFDCSASGAPEGSTYDYVWTTRGATPNTDKLSSTDVEKPTFDVPEEVAEDETYRYTLTASAENVEDASANVTVRVLNKEPLALVCTPVAPVYEGAEDFDLDCSASGAPSGSTYDYVWTTRGATPNTDKLSSTTVAKPTFDVPRNVNADTDYEYTLTASAENAEDASANVTVRVLNKAPLALVCTPPAPVYEGSADFALDCSASGTPEGSTYDYVWTARGATPNTDKLSSTTVAKPMFDVPEEVDDDETYEYLLTVSAENAIDATANVTVRVLNKEPLALVCTPPAPVYEGSEDFALNCSASGVPSGSTYDYVWTARGATPNTDKLSSTTVAKPTFDVPEEVAEDETYRYTLTASAENAEGASANVTVRVLNKAPLALICTPPTPVYEGSADFALNCSASGVPSGSTYDYVWTARGATPNTDKLSSTTIEKPTFDVPEEVAEDETYRYTLTASAENAEDASANVTVRVLNKEPLALVCTPPTPVIRRFGGLRPGLFGFGRAFGFHLRLRVDGQRRDAEYGQVEQYDH